MTRGNLTKEEYGPYYQTYLNMVDDKLSLKDAFLGVGIMSSFYSELDEDKLLYRYSDGKWSMKEVFQHVVDTERVFAHRAFRIGRLDPTPLPGFDQNVFMTPSGADAKSLDQ